MIYPGWLYDQVGGIFAPDTFAYGFRVMFLDIFGSPPPINPKPIIPISSHYIKNDNYYTDNGFLFFDYENNAWDTVRIDLTEADYWKDFHPNMHTIHNVFQLPVMGKFVITFGVPWEHTVKMVSKYFMLYDWETKTFEVFAPADSLLWNPSSNYLLHAAPYTDPLGNRLIGLLYNGGEFFAFNPNPTSIAEVENRGLPNIWFKSIYPNPATPSNRITAEIWYWLADISDVELGLYDFMGKKVLDLSNSFEYEQATATIRTTFEIPKSLAKGSYFLVVRSGKETRTKGIIVQ